jgi:ATP-dependent DNA helicase RecG
VNGPLASFEVAQLVASGEDSYTEFKDNRVDNDALAKEMCAFANADGGRILIGVGDDGGLHNADGWSDDERVMNIARTLLDPPIVPTYQRVQWDEDTAIVIVTVDPGSEKPYALSQGERRRYFMRVGSTSREATREELIRLTQDSGAVASDLRPVTGAVVEDLDPDLVAERFAGRRSIDFEQMTAEERQRVLIDAEILHPKTGGPTIAGLLCYGRNPQHRLPFAEIACVAYQTDSPGRELADRAMIGGRIDEQISGAVEFIARNIPQASTVSGVTRVETPRPAIESMREVVANAVAHRHYGIAGPAHVRVFPNRIEVTSPGKPPNGVTPGGMKVGVSVRRNQFLVKHLEERGLVDAVGRGVVLLFEDAALQGLAPPRISIADHLTTVVLSLV